MKESTEFFEKVNESKLLSNEFEFENYPQIGSKEAIPLQKSIPEASSSNSESKGKSGFRSFSTLLGDQELEMCQLETPSSKNGRRKELNISLRQKQIYNYNISTLKEDRAGRIEKRRQKLMKASEYSQRSPKSGIKLKAKKVSFITDK